MKKGPVSPPGRRSARRRAIPSGPCIPLASVLAALLGAPTAAPAQTFLSIPTDAKATITTPGFQESGRSVAVLGDMNLDGLDDFLSLDRPSSGTIPQAARVFFGSLSGNYSRTDSSTEGFDIRPPAGHRIVDACAAGDVNDDGLQDILVSTNDNDFCAATPIAYVVFGKSNHDAVDLDSLGSGGFSVGGFPTSRLIAISEAGDFDGDGFDDIVCGQSSVSLSGSIPITVIGAAYVVFGKGDNAPVDVSAPDGQACRLVTVPTFYGYVSLVAGGGDVNGDGFDDIVVSGGSYHETSFRVVFGDDTGTPSVAASASGFAVYGAVGASSESQPSVDILGDFDGDGMDDIVQAGRHFCFSGPNAHIIFGKNESSSVHLGSGTKSSRKGITGPIPYIPILGVYGFSSMACGVGDVDGDGLDDVLVGRETTTCTACTCFSQALVGLFLGDAARQTLEFDAPPSPPTKKKKAKSWVGRGPDFVVAPENAVAGEVVTMDGANGLALISCDGIFKSAAKGRGGPSANIVSLVDFKGDVECPDDVVAPVEECGGELAAFGPSVTTATDLYFGVTFTEEVSGVSASDFSGTAVPYIVEIDPDGTGVSFVVRVAVPGPGSYTLAWSSAATVSDCGANAFVPTDSSATVEVIAAGGPPSPNLQFAQGTGANGDRFGAAVAISGTVAAIGAPAADPLGLSSAGVVHVVQQDGAGSHPLVQVLAASDAAAVDGFGTSVAAWGDRILVGAPYDDGIDSNSGSAYLFRRDAATGAWSEEIKLVALQNAANWRAGYSVAVDGRTAVVGFPQGDGVPSGISRYRAGRAVVFEYNACTDTWEETAVLAAPDASTFDAFGTSVAVSNGLVIVGAPGDDDFGSSSGAAYAFVRSAPGVWTYDAKIQGADTTGGDNFGVSVSLRGTTAVVGAVGQDERAANAGAVYVFERAGAGSWSSGPKCTALDGALGDQLGTSVSTDGTTVVAGAPGHDANGGNAGAMYAFDVATGTQTGKFLTPATNASDTLGTSVAVDGARAVAGSPIGSVFPAGLVPTIGGTPGVVFFHEP